MEEKVSVDAVLIAAIVVLVPILLYARWKVKWTRPGFKLPPVAPNGFAETISNLTGNNAPWFLLHLSRTVGSVFRINLPLPGELVVVVGDSDVARQIMKDQKVTKPHSIYGSYERPTKGPTIFTGNGQFWKKSRKGIAPAFSSQNVKRMEAVCKVQLENWIKGTLEPSIDKGESLDIASEMVRLTLRIIANSALEYNITDKEIDCFLFDLDITMEECSLQSRNPLRNVFWPLFPNAWRAKSAGKNLMNLAHHILDVHLKNEARLNEDTVIKLIANNENYKNDEERAADIITMLIGGHDTTGNSIAFILFHLAQNPQEASILQKNLTKAPEHGMGTDECLRDVIREGMRLSPVAAFAVARKLQEDIEIKSYILPKDTIALIPLILLNRNPEYFEDPDIFVPSRWKKGKQESLDAFMPFALGPRNCVGQRLANAEIFHVIRRLCSDYNFSVHKEGMVRYFLTLKLEGTHLYASRA